ncbi:MAG: hypothetical protein KBS76_05770, partial [Ruminococcus sp.]|nr:hypothetical protein [Candidatus Apopatosoma intestinale]
AYLLAYQAMQTASGKLREGLSPKLSKIAGNVMSKFSGGKYKQIGLDGTDFSMNYFDGATHPVEALSAGTEGLAYISLRIALADLLYQKSKPPFVFDESFSELDDHRLSCALELLSHLYGKGSQCLVFTCHGREEEAMQKIGKFHSVHLS